MQSLPQQILDFNENYDIFYGGNSLIFENHPTFGERYLAYHGMQNLYEFWNAVSFILDRYENKSLNFLEIGAARGLWPFTINQFSESYNIDFNYTTITKLDDTDYVLNGAVAALNKVKETYSDNFTLINADSRDKENLQKLQNQYDIVFIDGCHDYDCVKSDIELYFPLARDIVMFHDIRPVTNEVHRAMIDSGLSLDVTFIDNELIMGIGLILKNEDV